MQGGAVVHEGSSAHEALTKHKVKHFFIQLTFYTSRPRLFYPPTTTTKLAKFQVLAYLRLNVRVLITTTTVPLIHKRNETVADR